MKLHRTLTIYRRIKAPKEDVGHGTKRNQRRALDNFLEITRVAGITKLEDVEIETIDLLRRNRPDFGNRLDGGKEALR
jgi:hypothetical protein